MTETWAIYKNEEEEINDFAEWLGGKESAWINRMSEKWMFNWEGIQFLYLPKRKNLYSMGTKNECAKWLRCIKILSKLGKNPDVGKLTRS